MRRKGNKNDFVVLGGDRPGKIFSGPGPGRDPVDGRATTAGSPNCDEGPPTKGEIYGAKSIEREVCPAPHQEEEPNSLSV